MANFFEKLARGVEAAQGAIGAETLAETNAFDLKHSATFPVAKLRRRKGNGEMVVSVEISDARATMTPAEFDRFVTELAAFRDVLKQQLP